MESLHSNLYHPPKRLTLQDGDNNMKHILYFHNYSPDKSERESQLLTIW